MAVPKSLTRLKTERFKDLKRKRFSKKKDSRCLKTLKRPKKLKSKFFFKRRKE
jgi:hypothetical protein